MKKLLIASVLASTLIAGAAFAGAVGGISKNQAPAVGTILEVVSCNSAPSSDIGTAKVSPAEKFCFRPISKADLAAVAQQKSDVLLR